MEEVLEFLKNCRAFFVATIEEGKPKVRPFSFVMLHDQKLYFTTGNQKPFFEQIQKNPEIEICGLNQKMEWIRLSGRVIPDSRLEIKQKAFEESPFLKNNYKSVDSPVMECFYLTEAKADFCKIDGSSRTVIL
ncbi:pyridoxamine 5'-phosphate oxidase family protein [Sebaldella sp. S0638]|uniref:pyridoxamine 5'-phosphate oxidase family protein n=1 Tax=Sebaldella sp. S0638 TaxID=2957809 RepID=UPI0020A00D12|nr:pyridoxamine 5'-phosphate oxidase family protein [Sebaldella sp. S0638]MCP1225662.1 pyridoxamine 5'-phosphate oxidase family protein [Sebaldella sp. S0638]